MCYNKTKIIPRSIYLFFFYPGFICCGSGHNRTPGSDSDSGCLGQYVGPDRGNSKKPV